MMNQSLALHLNRTTPVVDKRAEQQLVERACAGDRDAFGQLYEATFDRIYRYIFFRVTRDEAAEDLASKVYLKAWESLPRFQSSNAPFIAWLYTIAHNAVVDYYRTNRQHVNLDEAGNWPDHAPLPQEQSEERLDKEALRGALCHLTPVQQEVISLKLLNGLTTDEVAARLHKTPGAIRALQMRGLQSLAKILQIGTD